MHRPGFLNGVRTNIPKKRKRRIYSGLGAFGKGVMLPPPAPPGIPPGSEPPQYIEGKWVCSGAQPPSEADGYYQCCPVTGWTKTSYEDRRPCGENYGMTKCGPLPEGASVADAVCCENLKEWVPRDPSGDPCRQAALIRAQQTGQAVPGVATTILTEDIIAKQEPLFNPLLLMGGGLVIVILFVVTIILKLT